MKKIRNKYGFSMAELLMVVAILVALFGVAFVAVQRHQRSMTQLEYDTIAKEIFVAAQNHLTAAESQGYLGQITEKSGYGTESGYINVGTSENDSRDKVFYLSKWTDGQGVMLDLMLPFGAIDETIRAGGSYIIRYQPSTARVLDVFYSNPGPVTAWLTLKGADLTDHYDALMPLRGEENKAARRNCDAIGGAVVGWYGNGDALPVGARLKAPQVLIHNEETLWVVVKDTNTTNTSGALVLVVTGETSEAKKMFNLYSDDTGRVKPGASGEYIIVLDDITRLDSSTEKGLHFAEIVADTTSKFIPGENITIEAIAYNNGALTNIAYSGKGRTNSIFADPSSYSATSTQGTQTDNLKVNGTIVDKTSGTAAVANFRHLENLDKRVSNWGGDTGDIKYSSAIQLTNLSDGTDEDTEKPKLSWESFVKKTGGVIYTTGNDRYKTNDKQYLSVNLVEDFSYYGRNHIISKITTDGKLSSTSYDAGVFGKMTGGSISNLLILDSTISSSGDAGGLIGNMENTIVEKCAANGTVSSSGAAGGLIGSASGGKVTACYSGGHTDGKYASYYTDGKAKYIDGVLTNGIYNVISSDDYSGGLIGNAGSTTIEYSYSTCSAKGATVGGLVGYATGTINYSYATGLVSGTTEGAFAGSFSGTATDCHYYEIINERMDAQKGFTYVDPVSGEKSFPGITPLDASAQTYNDFSFPNEDGYSWQPAVPYDKALKNYYKDQKEKSVYNLKTIKQLVALDPDHSVSINDDDLVATHYGDWPAPEIFVINAKNQ